MPHAARASPATPPSALKTRLSARSWPISRSPAGSERRPHGELALPRGAGGQQQVGQVGAGDEQHDADGRSEHQQAAPRASHHRLEQRRHPHRLAVVAGRELLLQPGGDGGEVGARLVERRRRRQPAHAADEVPAAIGGGRVEPERQEDVGGAVRVLLDVAIARRQHADHGVGLRVHPHRPADDAGRAGEAPPPEPVTDERDRRRVGPILLRQERPAQRRLHPERREIGLRDPHHPDAFGVAFRAADGGRADEPVRAHRGERAGVAGVVEEIGRRQIADLAVVVVEAAHLDQLFGRRVGEWREQHRADHAEHRRVGADAEGERADGDQRRSRGWRGGGGGRAGSSAPWGHRRPGAPARVVSGRAWIPGSCHSSTTFGSRRGIATRRRLLSTPMSATSDTAGMSGARPEAVSAISPGRSWLETRIVVSSRRSTPS